jgi:hypothetical protein
MRFDDLKSFMGQKVVLVVQGHLMTGVLSTSPVAGNELVILTNNDNPLYIPTTVVSLAAVGAVRAYAVPSS